ncbi:MAG: TnpV protein, partial [Oscillospiraceae bacterium]|nr:TnpV protein [Oscillospiraceae bacterium]
IASLLSFDIGFANVIHSFDYIIYQNYVMLKCYMMKEMVKKEPGPDKATQPIEWAAHMARLKHTVEEICKQELIYS